jgi:uncharacterized protein (UPF0335 family)
MSDLMDEYEAELAATAKAEITRSMRAYELFIEKLEHEAEEKGALIRELVAVLATYDGNYFTPKEVKDALAKAKAAGYEP